MASGAPIAAHDNPFNRSVTEKNATYFSSAEHVRQIILDQKAYPEMIAANLNKIREQYNWQAVIDQYESFIVQCHLISTHE